MQQTKQKCTLLYLLVLLAMFLATPSMADSPSYNFLQAGYQSVDLDAGGDLDVDGDGYGVGGSFEIGDSMYAFATYAKTDFDFNVDLSQINAGIGYHFGISGNTDFFADVGYVKAEVDASGFGSLDEDGYSVGIGVRSNVSDLIELTANVNYVDFGGGGDSTAFGAGIWFNLTDSFALGLGGSVDDDVTSYGASVRLYFGR